MKNFKLLSLAFGFLVLVAIGCSKEGSTGPAGPAGPAGPDSVVHSNWITLSMDLAVNSGDSSYSQTIAASALTQRILDSGIVLTYLGFIDNNGARNVVSAAPYFSVENFSVGEIFLGSFFDYSDVDYRYVVVPGTVTAGNVSSGPAKGLTKQQLVDMSYEAVQKLVSGSSGKTTN